MSEPTPAHPPRHNAWTAHPWPPGWPDGAWVPLVAAFLTLLVGGLGLLAGNLPWLFPSLGPTIYMQTETPEDLSAQIKNVLGGHAIGIVAGYLAVFALGIAQEPSVFSLGVLTPQRVWAAVVAMLLTEGGVLLADVAHPPAAATTLLIALGALRPTLASAASLVAGVAIIAVVGEFFRHLRLGHVARYGRPR
jgi:hypothetical protein